MSTRHAAAWASMWVPSRGVASQGAEQGCRRVGLLVAGTPPAEQGRHPARAPPSQGAEQGRRQGPHTPSRGAAAWASLWRGRRPAMGPLRWRRVGAPLARAPTDPSPSPHPRAQGASRGRRAGAPPRWRRVRPPPRPPRAEQGRHYVGLLVAGALVWLRAPS